MGTDPLREKCPTRIAHAAATCPTSTSRISPRCSAEAQDSYLRSYLKVKMMPPGVNSVERSGYTLTILQKQPDGRWLLARDANLLTAGKT